MQFYAYFCIMSNIFTRFFEFFLHIFNLFLHKCIKILNIMYKLIFWRKSEGEYRKALQFFQEYAIIVLIEKGR